MRSASGNGPSPTDRRGLSSSELRVSLLVLSAGAKSQRSKFSTEGWFIGTVCALAFLTLVTLMACFVQRKRGGKYAGTPPPTQRQDVFFMGKGQLALGQLVPPGCLASQSEPKLSSVKDSMISNLKSLNNQHVYRVTLPFDFNVIVVDLLKE